jgi:hypothetical protein
VKRLAQTRKLVGRDTKAADKWLIRWPVWIMCFVGAAQMMVASQGLLTPWKGGGFGMFSTVDRPSRILVARGVVGLDTIALEIRGTPQASSRLRRRIEVAPTSDLLEALASRLLDTRWYDNSGPAYTPFPALADSAGGVGVQLSAVQITVFRTAFDKATAGLKRYPILSVTKTHPDGREAWARLEECSSRPCPE